MKQVSGWLDQAVLWLSFLSHCQSVSYVIRAIVTLHEHETLALTVTVPSLIVCISAPAWSPWLFSSVPRLNGIRKKSILFEQMFEFKCFALFNRLCIHDCMHYNTGIVPVVMTDNSQELSNKSTFSPAPSRYNECTAQWNWVKKLPSSLLLPAWLGRIMQLSPNDSFTIVPLNPFCWLHDGGIWPSSSSQWSGL